MNEQPTHVDCFSGVGGFCTGLNAAGFKTLFAIEKVQSCVDTYSHNHPDIHVIKSDIREVSDEVLKKLAGCEVDLVTAGMPCETFSTAGSKSRSSYDHRQTLFLQGIRVALAVNAKVILFENVPGILSKRISESSQTLIVDQLRRELRKAGYRFQIEIILSAEDFGIPQKRQRFFLMASRCADVMLQAPIPSNKKYVTSDEAICDLPIVEANEPDIPRPYLKTVSQYSLLMRNVGFWKLPKWKKLSSTISYHIPPKHRATTLKRFELIEQGEGLRDLFMKFTEAKVKALQMQKILPNKWYIQRNRRLLGGEPSVTVTSHCLDEILHPRQDRAITVREAARLQSFPDGYEIVGGPLICPHVYETQDKYEQIGDAVPPLLAYEWGLAIRRALGIDGFQLCDKRVTYAA
jgi:DNA (cytosine-5)-methyltransferase 1